MVTVSAEDVDSTITYILSGPDVGAFTLDSNSGEIRLANLPDYENPLDVNGDNTYEVTVLAVDDGNLTDKQSFIVSVSNSKDSLPVILNNAGEDEATIHVQEGRKKVSTIRFSDADGKGFDILNLSRSENKIKIHQIVSDGQVSWKKNFSLLDEVPGNPIYSKDINNDGFNDILSELDFDKGISWFVNNGDNTLSELSFSN